MPKIKTHSGAKKTLQIIKERQADKSTCQQVSYPYQKEHKEKEKSSQDIRCRYN